MPSEERVGILITARDMASGALRNVTGALHGLGGGASQIGKGLGQIGAGIMRIGTLAATVGVVGLGAAVKSAIAFQSAMELVQTQAGASAEEVANMSKALLGLAPAVGSTPEDLAAGLFHVESAGFRGAKALDVLTIAAEGAKVGHADLESVTNALVGALNSGVGGVKNTAEAMGVLNATVGAGNLRMQDLADAFGTGILSSAKNFGVSIQSVGAAIADLTRQGIPAQDAATRLRMSLSLLAAPTPKAAKLLESIGISSNQLALDMRGPQGILGAMLDLRKHLDASGLSATEQASLLSHAFGGGRSSSAILALVGDVQQLQKVQDQVNASTTTFPAAWSEAQQTVAVQIDKLKAGLSSAGITIGAAMLPAITPWIDKLSSFLGTHQSQLTDFGQKLSAGFSTFADALSKVDWSPLISGLKIARDVAKTVIDTFLKLPPAWQGAIISGLALNKLSGGLLGQGVANVAGGIVKMVFERGSSPAMPLWVASVGGIGGGIPGVGGTGGPGGVGPLPLVGLGAAAIAGLGIAQSNAAQSNLDKGRPGGLSLPFDFLLGSPFDKPGPNFSLPRGDADLSRAASHSIIDANAARLRTEALQAQQLDAANAARMTLRDIASRSPVINVSPQFTANITVNYNARLAAAASLQLQLAQSTGAATAGRAGLF